MATTRREVRTERLYVKVPGTSQLRKGAAGSLRHLLHMGWQVTEWRLRSDHVEVRLERTMTVPVWAGRLKLKGTEEHGVRRPTLERRSRGERWALVS